MFLFQEYIMRNPCVGCLWGTPSGWERGRDRAPTWGWARDEFESRTRRHYHKQILSSCINVVMSHINMNLSYFEFMTKVSSNNILWLRHSLYTSLWDKPFCVVALLITVHEFSHLLSLGRYEGSWKNSMQMHTRIPSRKKVLCTKTHALVYR